MLTECKRKVDASAQDLSARSALTARPSCFTLTTKKDRSGKRKGTPTLVLSTIAETSRPSAIRFLAFILSAKLGNYLRD